MKLTNYLRISSYFDFFSLNLTFQTILNLLIFILKNNKIKKLRCLQYKVQYKVFAVRSGSQHLTDFADMSTKSCFFIDSFRHGIVILIRKWFRRKNSFEKLLWLDNERWQWLDNEKWRWLDNVINACLFVAGSLIYEVINKSYWNI